MNMAWLNMKRLVLKTAKPNKNTSNIRATALERSIVNTFTVNYSSPWVPMFFLT